MKIKVEIRKLGPVLKGFMFSLIHPKTQEPFYEFVDLYEEVGKKKAEKIIRKLNTYLAEKEKEKRIENNETS